VNLRVWALDVGRLVLARQRSVSKVFVHKRSPPAVRSVCSVVARERLRALLRGEFGLGRTLHGCLVAHPVTVRGPDERCKQRVRRERLRLVLGVELAAQKPGVRLARQFDHLDEAAVNRDAAERQARLLQLFAELRVELVAVSVALAYLGAAAVDLARE